MLTSGQQVPVLGAVSYQGDNSTPVQSVEYRDSGVILRVRPVVHRDVIDLDIAQELSNFVRTDTGVNATPTLIKRALTNRLSLRSGDVIVLGGLTEDRDERAKSGFLGIGSRSKNQGSDGKSCSFSKSTPSAASPERPQRSEDAPPRRRRALPRCDRYFSPLKPVSPPHGPEIGPPAHSITDAYPGSPGCRAASTLASPVLDHSARWPCPAPSRLALFFLPRGEAVSHD